MKRFVINDPRVAEFVAKSVGSTDCQCHTSIGIEDGGKIVAGVTMDNFSGRNIFIHFATSPGVGIPRNLLKMLFGYSFEGLKCQRVSAASSSNNRSACRLAKLIGFKLEACLEGAAHDGDLLIYKLLRRDCRFIV